MSRDLTITDKFFQYLQAGIAVIATDTRGQREVFSQFPDCDQLVPCQSSKALADAIDYLLNSPSRLSVAKSAALTIANKTSWEKHSKKILIAAETALR